MQPNQCPKVTWKFMFIRVYWVLCYFQPAFAISFMSMCVSIINLTCITCQIAIWRWDIFSHTHSHTDCHVESAWCLQNNNYFCLLLFYSGSVSCGSFVWAGGSEHHQNINLKLTSICNELLIYYKCVQHSAKKYFLNFLDYFKS